MTKRKRTEGPALERSEWVRPTAEQLGPLEWRWGDDLGGYADGSMRGQSIRYVECSKCGGTATRITRQDENEHDGQVFVGLAAVVDWCAPAGHLVVQWFDGPKLIAIVK
jgi:hypothetical protein